MTAHSTTDGCPAIEMGVESEEVFSPSVMLLQSAPTYAEEVPLLATVVGGGGVSVASVNLLQSALTCVGKRHRKRVWGASWRRGWRRYWRL